MILETLVDSGRKKRWTIKGELFEATSLSFGREKGNIFNKTPN